MSSAWTVLSSLLVKYNTQQLSMSYVQRTRTGRWWQVVVEWIKDHIHLLPLYLWQSQHLIHMYPLLTIWSIICKQNILSVGTLFYTCDLLFANRTSHPLLSPFNHVMFCLYSGYPIYNYPLLTTCLLFKQNIPSTGAHFEPGDLLFAIRIYHPYISYI